MKTVDLVLHPIRLRIMQAFIGEDTLTARELAGRLPDVPQASLYRHLALLTEGGALRVAEERPVRGAVEKVYALATSALDIDLAAASPAEHLRYFATYLAALQGEFARYLGDGEPDLARDGVGYRSATLNLSDEEFVAFMTDLNTLVLAAMTNPPTPERRRRLFARVVMPPLLPCEQDPP